jgi:indolepyruvate ferredoxin oxidoreductase
MDAEMLSGTEALVRGMLRQAQSDRRNGLRTAGFVSGYRGSPFGNVDLELWRSAAELKSHDIVFQPGLNEDLAATACWGTQQVPLLANPRVDGVFAFWYGKGPGVDRSGDAFKHGNLAGTSPLGGVVLLAGDDHGAKSSSTAHQSEHAFVAASIPVLNPSSIEEYMNVVPAAVALSRFSGVWVGLKCATEIVEASTLVARGNELANFAQPEIERPPGGFHISLSFAPLSVEESLHRYRLPSVRTFVRANGFDRIALDAPRRTLGIVTAGKAYVDVMEALRLLGIDSHKASILGIRVLKLMVTWPIEQATMIGFCDGHREVLVVEEKRALIEGQVAQVLLRIGNDRRPELVGKTTAAGRPFLPEYGELTTSIVAIALGDRLTALGLADDVLTDTLAAIKIAAAENKTAGPSARAPMFCSGCPHNRSTRLPEGSSAFGGIGCHGMAMWIPELRTSSPTHMGGEGANWLGIAPFGGPNHMFQNMGDGTYAHSGLLAIRAAIAVESNITYKILCNSAVAMTGGQPVEGSPDAGTIARQMLAEGAKKVVLVSEDPEQFRALEPMIEVHHRDNLMDVQQVLREIKGVTVLVYDQGCAAERRRLRKAGEFPDPPTRSFINEDVCEGCGDCNAKSSCVSILPLDTELGVKRYIDQESCNKDFTCQQGFCPSFVTVNGGRPRRGGVEERLLEPVSAALQDPKWTPFDMKVFNIVLAGIGGTGVISLGTILASAAALEDYNVLTFDVTGVSQKNGAVFSHIRLLRDTNSSDLRPRVPAGQLDLLIGCDIIASTAMEVVQLLAPNRSRAVINCEMVPTLDFQRNTAFDRSSSRFKSTLLNILGENAVQFATPGPAVSAIVGSGPLLNIFVLGISAQQGLIPLKISSLETALQSGRGGKMNLLAFRMGRLAAQDRNRLEELLGGEVQSVPLADLPFDAMLDRCSTLLTVYQSADYARRHANFVRRIQKVDPRGVFSKTMAINLFKLMRYKDEYEVARLYCAQEFRKRLEQEFEGPFKLEFHLAPPIFSAVRTSNGEPRKLRFGGWMMRVFSLLQHLKFLRGTPFDLFGLLADRRLERRLIATYEEWILDLSGRLNEVDYGTAVAIAAIPETIRGYGPVKERNAVDALTRYAELVVGLSKSKSNSAAA